MKDLEEERTAVAKAIIKRRDFETVRAESFSARSESPEEVCLKEVRDSYIYIGIFKNRYGDIPKNNNPSGYSVTELEYQEAKKNDLPILIFIYKNSTNREKKLIEFLKKIKDFGTGHWCKEYSTTDELVNLVLESIDSELVRKYIETNKCKREKKIKDLYELPYFKKLEKEILK